MNADALADRVRRLEQAFETIAVTRMADVPMLHPGLAVKAIGFEPLPDGSAVGVLLTPWFMNLVWLPAPGDAVPTPVGVSRTRAVGDERFEFIGAQEDSFGAYEACSLFSPMFEFEDQAAAVATAEAVLAHLRRPPEVPASVPARRRFLLGRAGSARSA